MTRDELEAGICEGLCSATRKCYGPSCSYQIKIMALVDQYVKAEMVAMLADMDSAKVSHCANCGGRKAYRAKIAEIRQGLVVA